MSMSQIVGELLGKARSIGPPGRGKSAMIMAVARKLRIPVLEIKLDGETKMHWPRSLTAKQVRAIWRKIP